MQNIKLPQKRWLRWLLFSGVGIFSCCMLLVVVALFAPDTPEQRTAETSTAPQTTEAPTAEATAIPTEAPTAEPTAIPTETPTTEPTAIPTEGPTAEPTAVPTELPAADQTATALAVSEAQINEYLAMMVPRVLGEKTNMEGARLVEVKTLFGSTFEDVGNRLVTIRANDNLGKDLIVAGMLVDAVDYFEAISKNPQVMELESVTILFTFPMVDKYGNTAEAGVHRIKLNTATMAKMNWETFQNGGHRRLVDVADSYFLHAAFR